MNKWTWMILATAVVMFLMRDVCILVLSVPVLLFLFKKDFEERRYG